MNVTEFTKRFNTKIESIKKEWTEPVACIKIIQEIGYYLGYCAAMKWPPDLKAVDNAKKQM